jgi:FAD:protein FMN transferase
VRHVFTAMGTVVSIEAPRLEPSTTTRIEQSFQRLDREFSRYAPDSPASRVADGRLLLTRTSAEHRAMYAEAVSWRNQTAGAFDPHRRDGSVDLSGIVKAAAIAEAGGVLDDAAVPDWCVNAGGDVLVRGRSRHAGDGAHGRPWTVGVVDPADRTRLLGDLPLAGRRRAIATSGTSERGEHVWRSEAEATYRQVSVVADDIVTADVLATAVLAGGALVAQLAVERWGVDVVAVTTSGEIVERSPATQAGR